MSSALPETRPVGRSRLADAYWRAACLVAVSHVLGLTWPPPGRPQRRRIVGHWGCNPGIAWAVGHLAANWEEPDPLTLIVGTGHASSYLHAHRALAEGWDSARLTEAARIYGQPEGEPTEPLDQPVPYSGGELGPALAVSQGIAASLDEGLVVCIVGDGEMETPAALAALAHGEVLLGGARRRAGWLPIVNANGARMGGPSRFTPDRLAALCRGLGYRVVRSDAGSACADEAAREAIGAARREPVIWLSETEKGWPAPAGLTSPAFRGSSAHKPKWVDLTRDAVRAQLVEWIGSLAPETLLEATGQPDESIRALAARVSLVVPEATAPLEAAAPPVRLSSGGAEPGWSSPMQAVDGVLASQDVQVFSPDEAMSNGLVRCLRSGNAVEVLSEETCISWTWGCVEAGRPAAFVSYEAFAPLGSTQLVQYAKLASRRPPLGRPPLLVVQTSLGWANTPTHQNPDLAATALARLDAGLELVCPLGARSAAMRLQTSLVRDRDRVVVVSCSKQPLLDLDDPGTPAVRIAIAGAAAPCATVVTMGDVCATEAVAAAALAAQQGVSIEVVAVVDAGAALRGLGTAALGVRGAAIGAVWCAAVHAEPLLSELAGARLPVHGYRERWGATAWETLERNELDRISLLRRLAACGVRLDAGPLEETQERLRAALASDASGVPLPTVARLGTSGLGVARGPSP